MEENMEEENRLVKSEESSAAAEEEENLASAEETKPQSSHPIDKGWSWVIMLGVFAVHFMNIGYQRSFGILFVEFQERLGSSSALTSAISGSQSFSYCFLTLLVMNWVVKKVSVRTISIIGCLLTSLAIASSSLVPNTIFLIVTQGILFGCGHALIYCPSLLILSQYFDKRRPIATTIATCGSSLGGIVFPMATRKFLELFGLQGALLLLSGLILQELPFVIAYTPPENYKVKDDFQSDSDNYESSSIHVIHSIPNNNVEYCLETDVPAENSTTPSSYVQIDIDKVHNQEEHLCNEVTERTIPAITLPEDSLPNTAFLSKSHGHLPTTTHHSPQLLKRAIQNRLISKSHHALPTVSHHHHLHPHPHHHHSQHQQQQGDHDTSNKFLKAISGTSIEQINASMPSLLFDDLPTLQQRFHHHHHDHEHHQQHGSQNNNVIAENDNDDAASHQNLHSYHSLLTKDSKEERSTSAVVDQPTKWRCACKVPSVMKLPAFWILAVFFTCGAIGTGNPIVFIPPLAKERGLTDENAAFFLMLSSLVDMVGRLTPGLVLHFNLLRPTTLIIFPLTLCGLTYFMTPFFTNFESILALTLVYGLLSTSFWALQTLIVIEVLGLDRLSSSIGFYAIFMGFAAGASFPIGGSLRDITGTYSSSFQYFGTAYIIAAVAVAFLHLWMKRQTTTQVKVVDGTDNVKDEMAKIEV